jgi:hypothetical protein
MGFTFDVVTGSINGESMIAQTMAEIEEALKDVTDPAVRNEDDDENQGMLPLLRNLVPREPAPRWEVALALRVSFELGKAVGSGKIDAAELARLGGLARGAKRRDDADRAWRDAAKKIWHDHRGSRAKGHPQWKSQNDLAALIKAEIGKPAPDHDRIVKTISAWDRGAS